METLTKKLALLGLQTKDGNPVPLKEIHVALTVKGFVANVESTLFYTNEEENPVEAFFTFPVDDSSAVYKFEAIIDTRHIIAECQEKQQARETYQDAIKSGKTAMLLEEDDTSGDIFKCTLGNLPPKTGAKLILAYVIELPVEPDGKVKFTLPTVLNPRYSPDDGGLKPAPDAKYVPSNKIPYKFEFSATVDSTGDILGITAPQDKIAVEYQGARKLSAKVTLTEEFKFDHDLNLYIEYEDVYSPQAILERGDPQQSAEFLREDILMVNFFPELKDVASSGTGEFIFIVDRSGSMGGSRIKSAKETLLLFLKSLPVDSYFNIISFGSNYESLFSSGSEKYSEDSLNKAMKLQKEMDADFGGTEILRPLKHVYDHKPQKGCSRQLFLLTDGEVGNVAQVIDIVKRNVGNTRVFAVGIGEGASTSLVKGVARAGKGKEEFVKEHSRELQAKVMALLKCAMQPAVTDMEVKWNLPPGASAMCIPAEMPTIFDGERLILYALLQGVDPKLMEHDCTVTVTGKISGKKMKHDMMFVLGGESDPDKSAPLHRLAAKAQIKQLEQETDGDAYWHDDMSSSSVLKHISITANVISKQTAFVAVDKDGKSVADCAEARSCPVSSAFQIGEVSQMLGNLKDFAEAMSSEISSQNRQLDRINQKSSQNEDRILQANARARAILLKASPLPRVKQPCYDTVWVQMPRAKLPYLAIVYVQRPRIYEAEGQPKFASQVIFISCAANVVSRCTAFVAVDKDGKNVEGIVIQQSCPIPSYIPSVPRSMCRRRNIMSYSPRRMCKSAVQVMYQSSSMETSMEFRPGTAALQYDRFLLSSAAPQNTSTEMEDTIQLMRHNVNAVLERGEKLDDLDEKAGALSSVSVSYGASPKKKKTSGSFMSGLRGIGSSIRSAFGGSHDEPQVAQAAMGRRSYNSRQVNQPATASASKEVKPGSADMMDLIDNQGFQGNWTMSHDLAVAVGVKLEDIKGSATVKDDNVLATLVAVACLRRKFSSRRDEWEMIETKALTWLAKQNLERKSVEDLIKGIAEKLFP